MCDGCGAEGFTKRIETMLASGKYRSSYDVLNDIRHFIEQRDHITIKQMALVLKIERKKR